jgi:4-hydroxybenzoyl-CoA thioesterase
MARIQIDLPEQFPFSTEIALYLSHLIYTGHLDNALLLTLVSEARARYFESLWSGSASSWQTQPCSTALRPSTVR